MKCIHKGNTHEIRSHLPHKYYVADKILLKNMCKTKFIQDTYFSLYTITAVIAVVLTIKGKVTDTFNPFTCTASYPTMSSIAPIMDQYVTYSCRISLPYSS